MRRILGTILAFFIGVIVLCVLTTSISSHSLVHMAATILGLFNSLFHANTRRSNYYGISWVSVKRRT
ncbi:hypothetical protein, partial [Alicyclobacillus acidoterrestris]|uniref:hypothetical protein n=1 Tax=Alicyclobacillus acidoterrestris TaxID=1450 RepID=UPI001F2DB2D5